MGSLRWKMRGVHIKNSSTCRTLVNHQNPQAYFVSITVPQPKIRVKIPKLLMKTMKVRKSNQVGGGGGGGVCSESSNETPHNQMKTTMKKKKKKRGLSSLFSSVFGAKKPSKKDEMGDQDKKLSPMFKRHTLKEYFEAAKDDEHKREKKNVLTFIKEKVKKKKKKKKKKNTYSAGNDVETASICSNSCSGRLPRVPQRGRTTREKSRMTRSSRKMSSKRLVGFSGENGGRTESSRDKELCKKRILMGEKCKPLNYSGTLQYDKDGMLLPDIFSW